MVFVFNEHETLFREMGKCNNRKCSHSLGFFEVLRLSTECYFVSLSYSFVDMLRLFRACMFTSEREAANSVHCICSK